MVQKKTGKSPKKKMRPDYSNYLKKTAQFEATKHNNAPIMVDMKKEAKLAKEGGRDVTGGVDTTQVPSFWYSPELTMESWLLPKSRAEILKWCRLFYNLEPYIQGIVTMHAYYPFSKFDLTCDDKGALEFYKEQSSNEKFDLFEFIIQASLSYQKFGEALPFGSMGEREKGKYKFVWDSFILLEPELMEIKQTIFQDEPEYELVPTEELKSLVKKKQSGQSDVEIDEVIVEAIEGGRNIPLDPRYINPIQRITDPSATRGTPPIQACFKCLTGDTKVFLLNGESRTLLDLCESEEKDFWVYSIDPNTKDIAPGKANKVIKTGENQKVLKVTLDNDKSFKCTLDHKIMLRDGTYKRADELKENDSIMPLYKGMNAQGYEKVYNPKSNKFEETYKLVANNFEGKCIHHKNFKKADNRPENLQVVLWKDHIKMHRVLAEKGLKKYLKYLKDNPEIFKMLKEEMSARMKMRFQDPEFRKAYEKIWKDPERNKAISDNLKKNWQEYPERGEFASNSAKEQWKNEDYREMMLALNHDEEEQVRRNEKRDEYWNDKKREAKSKAMKKKCKDPEYMKMMSEAKKSGKQVDQSKIWTKERREKQSEIMKSKYDDPEFIKKMDKVNQGKKRREKLSENTKKQWQDPAYRELMEEVANDEERKRKLREAMQSEEYKELQRKLTTERWKDPKYRKKLKLAHKKRNKEVMVLNHTVVKVEDAGYEDVYDIETVYGYHNFALDLGDNSGVFTHQCLILQDFIRLAQMAIATRYHFPVELWTVGDLANDIWPTEKELEEFRNMINQAIQNPPTTLVYPPIINYQALSVMGKLLPVADDYEYIQDQIMVGLGVNKNLIKGEGPSMSNLRTVALEKLVMAYQIVRDKFENWMINHFFRPLAEANNLYNMVKGEKKYILPQIHWYKDLDAAKKDMMRKDYVDLHRSGYISTKTLFAQFPDLDFDQEQKLLEQEKNSIFDKGNRIPKDFEATGIEEKIKKKKKPPAKPVIPVKPEKPEETPAEVLAETPVVE